MNSLSALVESPRWGGGLRAYPGGRTVPAVAIVERDTFEAGSGEMLLIDPDESNPGAWPRAYRGVADPALAMLLVASTLALGRLAREGPGILRELIRGAEVDAYLLATEERIEDAGLDDFVADLGLAFPRH
jgi:hypothetical protein